VKSFNSGCKYSSFPGFIQYSFKKNLFS
jgi:hypothetical protein